MIEIDLAGLKEVQEFIKSVKPVDRSKMQDIGILMHGSIVRNFDAGGRPVKWLPLEPVTLAKRRKGRKRRKPIPLNDTGTLRGSIGFTATANSVEIGPSVTYGIFHQLGFTTGKLFKTDVPARPFLVVQESDERTMLKILAGE